MSTENPDVFEATCLDCSTTKSYFTPQGVTFFKMNHQGHSIRVKEGAPQQQQEQEQEEPKPVAQEPVQAAEPALEDETPETKGDDGVAESAREEVRLGNLVVDVLEEQGGRTVEVYGVAGGRERFSKGFDMRGLGALNLFLESGAYTDPSTLITYSWTPDKIDLSPDVAKLLDESESGSGREGGSRSPEAMTEGVQKQMIRGVPSRSPEAKAATSSAQDAAEEALLGKLSYVQPGEEYRLESVRVSRALRKFRWNTELPYVVGALFDDLLSVQSQTGMVKASLIESVEKLGYDFIAVEAPSGTVTIWFRKQDGEQVPESEDVPLEFGR